MLTSIRLHNWKSFANETVPLSPLTFLVGANATGKSNLLDAVRFLQGAAIGMTVDEVVGGREVGGTMTWPGIRGGAKNLVFEHGKPFTISSDWQFGGTMSHHIACEANGKVRISEESFRVWGAAPTVFHASRKIDGVLRLSSRPTVSDEAIPDESGVLERVATHYFPETNNLGARIDPLASVPASVQVKVMASASFFAPDAQRMRGWGNPAKPLGANCENISGILAAHCETNPTGKDTLIDWVNELCPIQVENIDFIRVPDLDQVMLVLIERGGKRIPAPSLSDGTLLFLGLYAALALTNPGILVFLEEIDTALHPKGIHLLVEFLEQTTRERGIQVIATTHSPVVLRWLSEKTLRDVVVFGRVPDHPGTITRRLGDLPTFDEVVKRERIDELFSSGWMEAAL